MYLYLLLICLIIALFLKFKYKIHIFKSIKEEIILFITLLIIMIPMDIWATKKEYWSFPGKGILGIHLFGLPIEEYLFVIIVSYFILAVHKAIKQKIWKK